MSTEKDEHIFAQQAIVALARQGMEEGRGGPFGCVIIRDEEVIGKGCNGVTSTNDPTAHAEIVAIRDACRRLGAYQLTGCTVYTSCEPCPMCLGALYWARPARIGYAATRRGGGGCRALTMTLFTGKSVSRWKEERFPFVHGPCEAAAAENCLPSGRRRATSDCIETADRGAHEGWIRADLSGCVMGQRRSQWSHDRPRSDAEPRRLLEEPTRSGYGFKDDTTSPSCRCYWTGG